MRTNILRDSLRRIIRSRTDVYALSAQADPVIFRYSYSDTLLTGIEQFTYDRFSGKEQPAFRYQDLRFASGNRGVVTDYVKIGRAHV